MTVEEKKLALSERNSLATLASIAGLSAKLKAYFGINYGSPKQLVDEINLRGWQALRRTVPGFGKTYAGRLYEVLVAANYHVKEYTP